MRVRIIAEPRNQRSNGIQLDRFHVGQEYDVGTTLAALLLCEGWAEPIDDQTPARLRKRKRAAVVSEPVPPNLVRDTSPPSYAGRAIAMDRSRRKRRKSR